MRSHIERANTGVVDVLFLALKSYENQCTAHQLFRGKTDHGRIIERNKIRFLYSGSHTLWETNKTSDSPTCGRILITFKVKFLFILTGDS